MKTIIAIIISSILLVGVISSLKSSIQRYQKQQETIIQNVIR